MSTKKHHPPLWADKLLSYFCRQDYADEILGDLHEAFYWRLKERGPGKAKAKFLWEVVKSLRPKNLKSFHHFSLNTMIFRNYIKIAIRTLLKRKSTSFINIFGLSLGAAAFVLIFLYAYQIISFDDHHRKKDRIFLAYKERITPDGVQPAFDTWVPMKDRFLSDYTQVKAAARVYETEAKIVKNNQYLEEDIMYTDEALFEVFTYPLLYGNEKKIFADKQSIVVSSEVAVKYFQKENAIGEVMEIFLPGEDTTLFYQVSAVLDRLPTNISYQPNMMVQMESIPEYSEIANNWGSSFLETFVLLDRRESAAELEAVFPDLVETIWGAEVRENTNFKLLPYEQAYDQFIGRKADAYTLLLIGFGILLIAAINFMNLSTAQASQRMKEIGLRKVLGAFRGQLRTQFVTEAFVTSLLAILIGVGLVVFVVPYFNDFFDVSISFGIFTPPQILSFCAGLAIALGVLSGSYPAIYLSSLRSIDALQQRIGLGGSANFRNILVVVQFSIALFLITSAILIRNQISFMAQKDMGFNS
ncbi:MAG: FtsX-like permease family protein, partial [Cyclobacteriaceae bacterium]